MTMHVYRVTRVLTGHSPIARIQAVDADGHELRIEVPVLAAAGATPGRVLVLQWSVHDVPAVVPVEAPEPVASASRVDAQSVDQDFMTLMARSRPAAAAKPGSSAQHDSVLGDRNEMDTLLGTSRRKG